MGGIEAAAEFNLVWPFDESQVNHCLRPGRCAVNQIDVTDSHCCVKLIEIPPEFPMSLTRLPQHAAQIPASGRLNLDHVAHFVAERDAAAAALDALGFTLTPFSEQSHRTEPGGPVLPAGTGNRCVMLREGYLEFLTPFADTPIAAQLREAIARYTGVHLIAYGSADAQADHDRLAAAGFSPLPLVRLQREADAPHGTTTVSFTVTRTPPGTMAEGRIQFCCHGTPEGVWQPRWLSHANGAASLRRVYLVVADPVEAAARYSRYAGIAALPTGSQPGSQSELQPGTQFVQRTARGLLHFIDADALQAGFGLQAPAVPWIGGYELGSDDLTATRHFLAAAGSRCRSLADGRLLVILPSSLGGFIVFCDAVSPL